MLGVVGAPRATVRVSSRARVCWLICAMCVWLRTSAVAGRAQRQRADCCRRQATSGRRGAHPTAGDQRTSGLVGVAVSSMDSSSSGEKSLPLVVLLLVVVGSLASWRWRCCGGRKRTETSAPSDDRHSYPEGGQTEEQSTCKCLARVSPVAHTNRLLPALRGRVTFLLSFSFSCSKGRLTAPRHLQMRARLFLGGSSRCVGLVGLCAGGRWVRVDRASSRADERQGKEGRQSKRRPTGARQGIAASVLLPKLASSSRDRWDGAAPGGAE